MTVGAPGASAAMVRERRLRERVGALRREVAQRLGPDSLDLGEGADLAVLADELPRLAAGLVAELRTHEALDEEARSVARLALDTQDLAAACHAEVARRRSALDAEVERGLADLRPITSSTDLLDRVCRTVVEHCGFERAMLSRVEGETWIPWLTHSARDDMSDRTRRTPIPLAECPLESAALAERRAKLGVLPAETVRRHRSVIALSDTRTYVVAPIVPAGRVVGFLHADHFPTARPADGTDRDALWAFAEGFGRVYERAILHERLDAQRDQIRETFDVAEQIISGLAAADLELVRTTGDDADPHSGSGLDLPSGGELDALLTEREREVLALMVKGCSNSVIAERLVIRDGTVKSHVKHILRKLGAVNRAEAIALSLGGAPGKR